MIVTGDAIGASEAYRMGLANRVVPASELMDAAEGLARQIASSSPIAVRFVKEAVRRGLDLSLDGGLALEQDLAALLRTTEDAREGAAALAEGRSPRWTSR
jgi:enoyl-CoA hydratase/carnithine racemase